jgi:hypothetical protein
MMWFDNGDQKGGMLVAAIQSHIIIIIIYEMH